MTGITANLWASAATFRQGTAVKASFVLLSLFDLTLTLLAVSILGLTELNPLISYLMAIPVLLLMVKLAIPLLIAWLMPAGLLLPSVALLVLVIAWDLKELVIYLV